MIKMHKNNEKNVKMNQKRIKKLKNVLNSRVW